MIPNSKKEKIIFKLIAVIRKTGKFNLLKVLKKIKFKQRLPSNKLLSIIILSKFPIVSLVELSLSKINHQNKPPAIKTYVQYVWIIILQLEDY